MLLWGQPLTPRTIGPLRRRVGYVIQEGGLFPHLTAAQNVTLAARYLGWEAERVGPPQLREGARIIQLRRFTPEEIGAMVNELAAKRSG